MKATLDPGSFRDAAVWAAGYAAQPGREGDPVLTGLLVDCSGETTVLRATDRDVWATAEVTGVVHDHGTAVLPSRLLADVASKLPDKAVELVVEDGGATLTCGTLELRVQTLAAHDYPVDSTGFPPPLGTACAELFRDALGRAGVAVGTDKQGPPWNTLALLAGPRLRLASVDRYRLAAADLDWTPVGGREHEAALLPALVVALAKELPANGTVAVHLDDRRFGLAWPGRTVVSPVVVADVPPYGKQVAGAAVVKATLEVDRADLLEALGRLAPGVDKRGDFAAKMSLRLAAGSLELTVTSDAVRRMREVVEATYDGPEIELSLNWAYLRAAVTAVGGERLRVTLPTADPNPLKHRKVVLTTETDPDYLHLVMLLRGGA